MSDVLLEYCGSGNSYNDINHIFCIFSDFMKILNYRSVLSLFSSIRVTVLASQIDLCALCTDATYRAEITVECVLKRIAQINFEFSN